MHRIVFISVKTYFTVCTAVLLLSSCRHKKNYEEIKYATGELMSRGWYCADNVPVDTMYEYYKNGQLSAVSVYDSNCSGKLNGVTTLFYRNGKIFKTYTYIQGEIHGATDEYSFAGRLHSKGYILHDVQAGDHYLYDTVAGRLLAYTFYNGPTNIICQLEYDSNRNVIKQTGHCNAMMRYRTVATKDNNQNKCLVDMINSNPPWRRTHINFKLFSGGSLVLQDSIINSSYFRKTYSTKLPVDSTEYSAAQYDSVTGKYHYFTSRKLYLLN